MIDFPKTLFRVTSAGNVYEARYTGPLPDNPRIGMYSSRWQHPEAVNVRAIAGLNGTPRGEYYGSQEDALKEALNMLEERMSFLRARLEAVQVKIEIVSL